MSLRKFLVILIIICIQSGQSAKHHQSGRSRKGSHIRHNKNLVRDESDTSMDTSSGLPGVDEDSLDFEDESSLKVDAEFARGHYLFPATFDIAPYADISANATCGTMFLGTDETFCKLSNPASCSVCNDLVAEQKHSISFAIDGDHSNWWQSPSLYSGSQYEYVTITMDLKQEYYVWSVIIRCANSPRPANWILEHSIDGKDYLPWQYFAHNEDDCWKKYNRRSTTVDLHTILPDNEILCTTVYSRVKPWDGGQIHANIAKGRRGCVFNCSVINTNELKEFSRARYLRFRFQKFNIPKDKYSSLSDPSLQRSLFYSIRKITVSAQCICHGHASICKHTLDESRPHCECSHNTCGNNCERCCPLYNQRPWEEGAASEINVCEQCQCHGHAEACRYDAQVDADGASLNIDGEYSGGGVCINCTKHTTGNNCEKCETGWYRPAGVAADAEEPCLRCDCHVIGSTGACIPDAARRILPDGKSARICECLAGFSGENCDKCATGLRNFPECEKCACDTRGMLPTESCEKRCVCKENVMGDNCDQCKPGFFDLSEANPQGCRECYCSGVAGICSEATGYSLQSIRTLTNWTVTGPPFTTILSPTWVNEMNVWMIYDTDARKRFSNYYWSASDQFVGNKLTSYGLVLRVSIIWSVQRGDTSGEPVFNPDIIIAGSNGIKIAYGNRNYDEPTEMMLAVRLSEDGWYRVEDDVLEHEQKRSPMDDSRKISRKEMMSVLSDVKFLLVRAKFHDDQVECIISEVDMQTAVKDENSQSISSIEQCYCPTGYTGLSCEVCDYGYIRVRSGTETRGFVCTSCDCNGHSPSCDLETRQCQTCEHNTTGTKCESCKTGFYGSAATGTPEDCKMCACPRTEPSNNFSPTCALKDGSSEEYVCDHCQLGYDGDHCERCTEGYFGDPTQLGGTCVPCNCSGNPCNSTTGQCLSCTGNTDGWHCEQCRIGYYGNAIQKNCSECNCDPLGSQNTTSCDPITGQCLCKTNFVGRTCNQCLSGYGDYASGCTPCSCNILGSKNQTCNPISGLCECKDGVVGKTCDRCTEDYFGFETGYGCQYCNCSVLGSVASTCDSILGQCSCKRDVVGKNCDQCQEGFYGLDEDGCKPCDCDGVGSISSFCHPDSGQCTCKYGVTGTKCNRCQDNFYGFSKFGCFECEPCNKPGHVCNINSGRCVCPFQTEGVHCEHCVSGAWNYNPFTGCQDCLCDKQGSRSNHCNFVTGQCDCRAGYSGVKCNECAAGYFDFPKCRPCSCHAAGCDPETCFGDRCLCDSVGQCYCKANTMGRKCDQCKAGTFGLHADNVGGCTACFCFGRSTQCSEAGLTWSHTRLLPDRILLVRYDVGNDSSPNFSSVDIYPVNPQQICYINYAQPENENMFDMDRNDTGVKLNVTNNLRLIPGISGNVEIGVNHLFDAPIYWQLPDTFLGDKVLSYGGFIKFTTNTEGEKTLLPPAVLASYPLIQIQGNDKFILEYFPPLTTSEKEHRVRLHESLWKLKSNPAGHVSRETLMLTLQNLQHILIRATDSVDFTSASLSDVSMDVAMRGEMISPQTLSITHSVEICECPDQYSSSSCQNPSIGYYRYYDNQTIAASTIIIQIVGDSVPCECNGFSSVCDVNSGACLNCTNNRGGRRCERCADGYFKNETSGECDPCPCPNALNNHAYACYVPSAGNGADQLMCNCEQGYTGRLCDKCSYEYYGYPTLPRGKCQRCNCNHWGMASEECDEETGQCNCKPDVVGKDCSICLKKDHVLSSKGCIPCADTCIQLLRDKVDNIAQNFMDDAKIMLPKRLEPLWNSLQNLNESYHEVERTYIANQTSILRIVSYGESVAEELRKKVKNSKNKVKNILKHTQGVNSSVNYFLTNVSRLSAESSALTHELRAILDSLEKYIQIEKGSINLPSMMNEARYLLNNIIELGKSEQTDKVDRILGTCRITYESVKSHDTSSPGLDLLEKRAQNFEKKVDDSGLYTAKAVSLLNEISEHIILSKHSLEWMTNVSADIDNMIRSIQDMMNGSRKLNDETTQSLRATVVNLRSTLDRSQKLKNLIQVVESKEGMLFNLNESYRQKYVLPAIRHADMLANQSRYYEGLLVPTRQDADIALQASRAYTDIVDAVREAEETIEAVNTLINASMDKMTTGTSVVERAQLMEEKSRELLTAGKLRKVDVENLKMQYENQLKYADFLRFNLAELGQNITSIATRLSDMNTTNHKIEFINDMLNKNKSAIDIKDDVYDSIFNIQDKITDGLRPKLRSVQSYGEIGLRPNDELQVREAEEITSRMTTLLQNTQRLFDERTRYFDKWNSSVGNQLQSLRDQIEETKHLANGIQLSLSSKSDHELCSRSYTSKYVKPSITNYISLTYAISTHHRDALLFYLASSISDDFLAIEMVNRKIRFSWDLGGGPAELTHFLHIQTAGDLQKDQHWYKIDVERISSMGRLSVRPVAPSAGLAKVETVTNHSVSGWNRFDVANNDPIWVGGVNKPITSFILSKQAGLVGCLSRVLYDNRPIGLWNFKSETPGQCFACVESAKERTRDDGSYFFTGDGYAAMQALSSNVYNKYFFSVSFNFKTFDENSILFYATGEKLEQFVSVIIKEGRIVFQIGYTKDNILEIRSSSRYMTGNWTYLEATRYYDRKKKIEKGMLKVDREAKEGFPPSALSSQSEIPDLSVPQYFFGGLSPGFEPPHALPQSFLGCMSDLQISQETYNPFRGRNWGVQKTCSEKPVTIVGFKGNGYLELESYPLKKTASFSFVFSTNQFNAFLMLSTSLGHAKLEPDYSPDAERVEMSKVNFYSTCLREGRVELIVNAGRGNTRLISRPDVNYSDGQYHALSVIKTAKRLELRVDDVIQAIGFMEDDGSSTVHAAGQEGGLFFGGTSDSVMNISSVLVPPLAGTIKDAIFNEKLLHFDEPKGFEHALIGRPSALPKVEEDEFASVQSTQGTNSCHKSHAYSVEPFAVQFGDLPRSYVRLDYDRQVFHNKNATIQLMFRTFYRNGILLFIPGAEDKHGHYVKLFLYNGTIHVLVKGNKKKIEMRCEITYDDNDWHRVRLVRDGKFLFMTVDDLPEQKKVIPKKLNLLNALYVGGYSSEVSIFENSRMHVDPLKGCIKEVLVNGRKEDLVGERAKHHHVGQCFPRVERGAYFSGDSYSAFTEKFEIGGMMLLEFEFRTSELNGILVSISEPQGYPSISLELVRGKVVLNGDMGDRRPFRIELEFSSTYYVCDNNWHRVKVSLMNEEMTLNVDGKNKMYWLPDNGHITEARTNSPLFIGGIAETAIGGTIENRENFKGCIRNVTVGERAVEWTEFYELHNVLVSSCPVQ